MTEPTKLRHTKTGKFLKITKKGNILGDLPHKLPNMHLYFLNMLTLAINLKLNVTFNLLNINLLKKYLWNIQ